MELKPLQHKALRSARKAPSHAAVSDADGDPFTAIGRVEVGRIMIAVENRNGDSEEPADDGHAKNLPHN